MLIANLNEISRLGILESQRTGKVHQSPSSTAGIQRHRLHHVGHTSIAYVTTLNLRNSILSLA